MYSVKIKTAFYKYIKIDLNSFDINKLNRLSMKRAGILNTSVATENTGDHIIMDGAIKQLNTVLNSYQVIQFTSHERLSSQSYKLQKLVDFNIACGTNLLHSHMGLIKQWNVGLFDAFRVKPVVLFGVGWRSQKKRKTDFYTKWLLRKLLSHEHLHSVRDSYSEQKLIDVGFDNVINTGCPTIWNLDKDHCRSIPNKRAENALVVLTDYSRDYELDREILEHVLNEYKKVFFWCQGTNDQEYLNSFDLSGKIEVIPSSLNAYNQLLSDKSISLDYVGTRLHGGIRALQHKRRAIIIGVDHRAIQKGIDFNLPVIDRYEPMDSIRTMISDPFETNINLPEENIIRWKEQFLS